MEQIRQTLTSSWYLLIPLSFLIVFLISWWQDRRKIVNGLLFNLFMMSAYATLLTYGFAKGNLFAIIIATILTIILGLILALGAYALVLFLFWNARQVWKKEGHALPNMLTLILAFLLTVLLIMNGFSSGFPNWLKSFIAMADLITFYLGFVFLNYFTVNILYQFYYPAYHQDYVVVLGAGLIDGLTVTPLLAQRIDVAIKFYHRQLKKSGHPIKILMSGGQGPDEKISEAEAMGNYAESKGIPREDILLETHSKNTLENMRFSKEIMDQVSKKYTAIFASSDYHIFRASLFAKEAALKANGIGSKTAFYYLPNAFLREFAAIIMRNKKRHFIIIGLIVFTFVAFNLLTWILIKIGAMTPM